MIKKIPRHIGELKLMQDFINVTGMILKQTPVGEYDRRVCLLTKEKGKIVAFAKGARRPGNRLAAATNPFSFGVFKLHQGRNSYTISEAEVQNYFEDLRSDFEGAYFGMYFLEVADYYTRENNDERQMLKLLYQSIRALTVPALDRKLVKCIYELKTIGVNGEYPGTPNDNKLEQSTVYALEFIQSSSIEKLYTFAVSEKVLEQLREIATTYRKKIMHYDFKSLEILNQCF